MSYKNTNGGYLLWNAHLCQALLYRKYNKDLCEINVTSMAWIVSSKNSCVEALTPRVTLFWDRAFKKLLRVNEVIRVGS